MTDTYSLAAAMAEEMGGEPADIPGLWFVPGYGELTTAQVFDVHSRMGETVNVFIKVAGRNGEAVSVPIRIEGVNAHD